MQDLFSSYHTTFGVLSIVSFAIGVIGMICGIIAIIYIKKIRKSLDILFAGKKVRDLEGVIMYNNQKLKDFDIEIQELFNISNTLHKQTHKSINKVGLIRFDPFKEYTGNQSFALALLDSKKNGVVMSSIHTREGTRIYAKNVKDGTAVIHELTQEEQDAIAQAH
jgi:hypothetical protein